MSLKKVRVFMIGLIAMAAQQAWAAPPPRIDIQSPKGDQAVGAETMVTGKVSDPQSRVYVLVRPLRTPYWWVQQIPAPPSSDGRWQALCAFGTQTEGEGESYEIIAITSKSRLGLKEGQRLEQTPEQSVSSGVVTVKRSP